MDTDVKNIQPEVVSEGATPTVAPEVTVAQPQPLTEEVINKRISEAIASATEKATREIQSVKDKSKAEIERAQNEAKLHRETFSTFKSTLGELEPEVANKLELAELKAKDRAFQSAQQSEQVAKQQQETLEKFNSNMTQFITESGLDPTDKRVDWGSDAQTLLDKQAKILASVAKIHKANAKDSSEKQSQLIKDEIAKVRKELNLDSVDTSNSVGIGSSSKADLNKKYANGDISYKEYGEALKKL
jgi:hypothetical protein